MYKEEYVEDLKVRRELVKKILNLLRHEKEWRPDCGIEPMHKYHTNCDFLDDHVIDTILPEEGFL